MLQDTSDGGLCLMLDGGCLTRGTSVSVSAADLPSVVGWVCHNCETADGWRVGLSFTPVSPDAADGCSIPEICGKVEDRD